MSHRTRETQGTDALLESLGGPSPACTLTSAQGDPCPSVTCRRARVWCVQPAAPANRPRSVATPLSPDLGPLGEAGRPRGRASRCWFWEAEPAASGPVGVAHMAPTPGLAGGVRGREAPHLGPGELPAQLGDTSSWPALPGNAGSGCGQPRPQGQVGNKDRAGQQDVVPARNPGGLAEGPASRKSPWQVSSTATGLRGPSEVAEAPGTR